MFNITALNNLYPQFEEGMTTSKDIGRFVIGHVDLVVDVGA